MATIKEKCLIAIGKLIDRYELLLDGTLDWKEDTLMAHQDCPLCNVYWKPGERRDKLRVTIDGREFVSVVTSLKCCKGCPSANDSGSVGCIYSPTHRKLYDAYNARVEDQLESDERIELLEERYYDAVFNRLRFWKEAYSKLSDMDMKLFRPSSNHFFDLDNTIKL